MYLPTPFPSIPKVSFKDTFHYIQLSTVGCVTQQYFHIYSGNLEPNYHELSTIPQTKYILNTQWCACLLQWLWWYPSLHTALLSGVSLGTNQSNYFSFMALRTVVIVACHHTRGTSGPHSSDYSSLALQTHYTCCPNSNCLCYNADIHVIFHVFWTVQECKRNCHHNIFMTNWRAMETTGIVTLSPSIHWCSRQELCNSTMGTFKQR